MKSTRRKFIGGSLAAAGGVMASKVAAEAEAVPVEMGKPEKLVKELYGSLNEKQRGLICLPWEDGLREEIDNNWHITKSRLSRDFTADQQALVKDIFMGLHSEEYGQRVYDQVESDGGFGTGSVAIFGDPKVGDGKFQFVYTGRHCTRRCDGNTEPGAAFGGPIFYGHAAGGFDEGPDHEGNAYWYQAERANEVFQMLDGKQREMALIDTNRREQGKKTIELTGKSFDLGGIPLAELTQDQQEMVGKTLEDLLAPFRERDRVEAKRLIEMNGFENLHMSFSRKRDIGNDGVWDVWELQGPTMIWYFRGDPHVHTWVHVREDVKKSV